MSLRQRLKRGERLRGLLIPWSEPSLLEVAAMAGCDYIILDGEHAGLTPKPCEEAVTLAKRERLPILFRVPENRPMWISQFLDIGADGIVVPHVDSAASAEAVVAAACFPPVGVRGIGPARANRWGTADNKTFIETSNDETVIFVQIEDAAGLANADAIMAVERIDGVMIGPRDLASSLGCYGDSSRPEVQEAIDVLIRTAQRHGVATAIPANTPEAAAKMEARGIQTTFGYWPQVILDATRALVAREEKPPSR